MRQIAYVMIGVLVGFILAGSVFLVTRLPAGEPIALEPAPTKVPLEVHIIGGVLHPGVYHLPQGSRVQDAVDAAGGLLSDADPSTINLAAKLEDGQQVQIPGGAERASTPGAPFSVLPGPTGVPTQQATLPSGELIDINSATLEELESLPGIGPTTAQNIIDYRNQHGPFEQIEDIMNVPGIGPSTFDAIQDLITAG
jgi:competence protein ComEA